MLPLEKRLGVAIPRVALGRFPTPVETHPELARELGFASLSIKREDKSALDGPGGKQAARPRMDPSRCRVVDCIDGRLRIDLCRRALLLRPAPAAERGGRPLSSALGRKCSGYPGRDRKPGASISCRCKVEIAARGNPGLATRVPLRSADLGAGRRCQSSGGARRSERGSGILGAGESGRGREARRDRRPAGQRWNYRGTDPRLLDRRSRRDTLRGSGRGPHRGESLAGPPVGGRHKKVAEESRASRCAPVLLDSECSPVFWVADTGRRLPRRGPRRSGFRVTTWPWSRPTGQRPSRPSRPCEVPTTPPVSGIPLTPRSRLLRKTPLCCAELALPRSSCGPTRR